MSTRRQWSLLVPMIGLALAGVLLPVATARWVPYPVQSVLGYLVVWVPLAAATVVAVIIAKRRSADSSWMVLGMRWSAIGVLAGAFVGLALRCVALLLELLAAGRIAGGIVGIDGGSAPGFAGIAGMIAASALVGPIIEEAFFRGVLLPATVERAGRPPRGPWVGLVVTAALFAGVHALAGAAPVGTLITFIAGIGFGLVARSSGLSAAIIAHIVFNASGLALVLANTAMSPVMPTLGLG
jgi:membrane protease YdiL (CAAX protease family)